MFAENKVTESVPQRQLYSLQIAEVITPIKSRFIYVYLWLKCPSGLPKRIRLTFYHPRLRVNYEESSLANSLSHLLL